MDALQSTNLQAQRIYTDCQEEVTRIVHLNDDCLDKLFGNLDLKSLFNVAVANEYLRPAAGAVYKRNFGKKIVLIRHHVDPHSGFIHYYDGIKVLGLKTCLQYLRCFGSSISDLHIWYDGWNEKQCEHIHHYVNKYCTRNLVRTEFKGDFKRIHFDQFNEPFDNVRTVKVSLCDLGDQLPLFRRWFPKIHTLHMVDVQVCNIRQIGIFQHLQELQIDMNIESQLLTSPNASSLLQLCPQLQSLKIHGQTHTLKTLLDMITDNRAIYKLTIFTRCNSSNVSQSNIQQIVSEHPSLVELELGNYRLTAGNAISLIRQLKSLTQFRFQIDDQTYNQLMVQLDDQWQRSTYWRRGFTTPRLPCSSVTFHKFIRLSR